MRKQNPNNVFLSLIFGAAILFLSQWLLPIELDEANIYLIPFSFITFLVGYILQIIHHEIGHLIFGWLTGYRFVYFRVGVFTIVKQKSRLKFRLISVPGTVGQCIMSPPDYNEGAFPFILYNLGGVLTNFVVAGLAFLIIDESLSVIDNMILIGIVLGGVFMGVINGIPRMVNEVNTDGRNVLVLKSYPAIKATFWFQLKANEAIINGERPRNLPIEAYQTQDTENLTEPLMTGMQLLRYKHYLDKQNIHKAHACLEAFRPYEAELISSYKYEIQLERLYLSLIMGENPQTIDAMLDYNTIQLLYASNAGINQKRIRMAYEWYYHQNIKNAMECWEDIEELTNDATMQGYAEMERMLAFQIKEEMEASDYYQHSIKE